MDWKSKPIRKLSDPNCSSVQTMREAIVFNVLHLSPETSSATFEKVTVMPMQQNYKWLAWKAQTSKWYPESFPTARWNHRHGKSMAHHFQANDLKTWGKRNFNKLIFIKIIMRRFSFSMFYSPPQEESTNLCMSTHRERISLYFLKGDVCVSWNRHASRGLENQTEGTVCGNGRDKSSTILPLRTW